MIKIQDIFYKYPESDEGEPALRGVSLNIQAGERIAVMGSNGSGKSTLMRCLNGLIIPNSGHVEIDGMRTDVKEHVYPIRERVGMVFQNPDNQMVATTVERELAFGLENIGTPREEMHKRVEDALNQFRLAKYRQSSPHQLSGGERQRLALASVWVMQPKVLVMDEPTSLLDPIGRKDIFCMLDSNVIQKEMILLFVTQYPEEAMLFDRLLVLHEGKLVMDDHPEKIFQKENQLSNIGLTIPVRIKLKQYLKEAGFEN